MPKDQRGGGIYYKNNMALIYQYRIDFFRNVGLDEAKKISQEAERGKPSPVQPFKSMTFQQHLDWKYPPNMESVPAAAVCTNPTIGYSIPFSDQSTKEEEAILGPQVTRGGVLLRNPKGQFHDFCGVINADGSIAQMPRPWKLPMYNPLGISSDGKEALFGAGHMGMASEDADYPEFICQYFIRWSYPNKIEKLKITQDKFHVMVSEFGALECAPPNDEVK